MSHDIHLNEHRKPQVGDKVVFYPSNFTGKLADGVKAEIVHVWTDSCVNLRCEDGSEPTSVLLFSLYDAQRTPPSGYYCMFDTEVLPDEIRLEVEGRAGFAYDIGDTLKIDVSGETGIAVARAQYLASEDGYLLRYKNALGQAVESWWSESALTLVESVRDKAEKAVDSVLGDAS